MRHVSTALATALLLAVGFTPVPAVASVHSPVPQAQGEGSQDVGGAVNHGQVTYTVTTTAPSSDRSPEAAALGWSATLPSATTVVIATTSSPADALTAGALQGEFDAPLLFADTETGLSDATRAEIQRLGATQAYILGGPQAVPAHVEGQLSGLTVERLSGPTRIQTALAVANEVNEHHTQTGRAAAPQGFMLVRALDPNGASDPTAEFSDALGAGAFAAEQDQVILLTPSDHIPAEVLSYLRQFPNVTVTVVGGEEAISDQVVNEIPEANPHRRLAGESRVETAAELARSRTEPARGVTAVNAFDEDAWAEGLAAANYVERNDHALALVHPEHVNEHLTPVVNTVRTDSAVPIYLGDGVGRPEPTTAETPHLPEDFVFTDLAAEEISTQAMNAERIRQGMHPVKRVEALNENARNWSRVMLKAGDIWHPEDWVDQIRTTINANPNSGMQHPTGENLFLHPNVGAGLGEKLHKGWHESPGHAQNMYNRDSDFVGAGVVCTVKTCYATQRFAAGE